MEVLPREMTVARSWNNLYGLFLISTIVGNQRTASRLGTSSGVGISLHGCVGRDVLPCESPGWGNS